MFDDNVKESWTRIGEKFKFKREKNKLLMRDSKFFGNMEMTVTSQYKDEDFKATYPGLGMYIQYSDGKFGLSDVGAGMIRSFIADCDIW